jgi:hypothetical protein
MENKLKMLVGRYVRLKTAVFAKVARRASHRCHLENLFVVAAITHGVNKLICYGGDLRISVSPSDIVMV